MKWRQPLFSLVALAREVVSNRASTELKTEAAQMHGSKPMLV
ncbi:MAG: hypothetical protein QMB62_05830 [Oscillospiraceae bacterium]